MVWPRVAGVVAVWCWGEAWSCAPIAWPVERVCSDEGLEGAAGGVARISGEAAGSARNSGEAAVQAAIGVARPRLAAPACGMLGRA